MNKKGKRNSPFDVLSVHYETFRQELTELISSTSEFKEAYLLKSFESKLLDNSIQSAEGRRAAAIEKWLSAEVRNRVTNCRLMFVDKDDVLFTHEGTDVGVEEFQAWCRRQIARVIGDAPDYELLSGSFSSGASTSIKRGVGVISEKYQSGVDITYNAIEHYLRLTRTVGHMPRDFNIVTGNVMFTVPKTSVIDRCACKEPDLNMYCQKAVGDFFRRRLRRFGIDLNDQSVNQELARIGSIDGSLATVDLSSASDSVTKQLVISMLPIEWTHMLFDLRSEHTLIDGVEHENEMISSMGNAFTFELESLLFWTITRGVAYFTRQHGPISVYGDDIICPVGLENGLTSALSYFGFVCNESKSFWSGDFRESCGKHWFKGVDVTPFYVKSKPSTISQWCHLLNSLRRWASLLGVCDPRYYELWLKYAKLIPRPLWGAKDMSRIDALAVPYMRNIAKLTARRINYVGREIVFQSGSYTWWCDTTKDRTAQSTVSTDVFFKQEDFTRYGRETTDWSYGPPAFPQEM